MSNDAVIRYVVSIDGAGDLIIEDPELTLDLGIHWATFNDSHGLALTVSRDRVLSIQRLDEPPEDPAEGT
ncbi:hypothetical protein JBE04_02020 [Streptomyces sp. PRKS01-29]|nr:hypothetical protein [Streptomyces sabulosicollis]MBI0293305.1 hypothetical protein [Streptomyces sabulosicollis]